jgi:exodeoxyribonuclease III
LLDRFRRAGFAVIKTPEADGERGSALISRVRVVQDLTAEFAAVSVPCRVSAAMLGSEPTISVIGVYVPSRDRSAGKTERKQRFIRTEADADGTLTLF